jgi:hypothetical protein
MGKPNHRIQNPEVSLLPYTFSAGLAILSHFLPVCFTPFEKLYVLRTFEVVGNPFLVRALPDLCFSYLINAAGRPFPELFT